MNGKMILVGMAAMGFLLTCGATSNLPCIKGESFLEPDPTDCSKFYRCNEGTVTHESCPPGQSFNCTTVSCDFAWDQNCPELITTTIEPPVGPPCYKGQNFTSLFPGDCHKYFDCKNAHLSIKTCPTFQVYDWITSTCTYEWKFDCNTPTTTAATPTGPPICLPGENYIDVFPEDCKKYYKCSNGNLKVKECFFFRDFSRVKRKCDWSWKVDCSVRTTLPPPPTTPTSICGPGMSFKAPYPDSCKKYFECLNGVLKLESCGILHRFCSSKRDCEWFWKVDCSKSTAEIEDTHELS